MDRATPSVTIDRIDPGVRFGSVLVTLFETGFVIQYMAHTSTCRRRGRIPWHLRTALLIKSGANMWHVLINRMHIFGGNILSYTCFLHKGAIYCAA